MAENFITHSHSKHTGQIGLDLIAQIKDDMLGFLQKRGFKLVSFTYLHDPQSAAELNKKIEDQLDGFLLTAHKQLASHRLYGDCKTNVALYNSQLKRLEDAMMDIENCYSKYESVKENNPDPSTVAVVPILGIEDLEKKAKESSEKLNEVMKRYESLNNESTMLYHNTSKIRKNVENLKHQAQLVFFKQARVASLADELALARGKFVKDIPADRIHKASLSQASIELSAYSCSSRIKNLQTSLEKIPSKMQSKNGVHINELMDEPMLKSFDESILNNTDLIFKLSKAAEKMEKITPAKLRIQRDLGQLSLPEGVEIRFPDLNDIMNMEILVTPREGIWEGMRIRFSCRVPEGYPHDRLRIKCISKILHPNILGINAEKCQGAVCLNIIREDWKPIYTLSTAIMGLVNLLLEPQCDEPLDQFSADLLRSDPERLKTLNVNLNLN
ncbi:hypothetical protein MACK_000705 [Theileria orientalis]|uniref:UBC core domain-containing protein n=1 Tax=Theileria orientalis TaxID=68886 RepID=A0A976MAD0_THEOR|nr:hypothetical protein MACK_000705 [Theileria orientalis]